MGLISQTIAFTTGLIPTATQWTNQFDTVYNLVNGQLDSANVDKTSSDGIMVLDTAQTRTGTLTHNGDITVGNTFGLIIGGATQQTVGGVVGELQVVGTAAADATAMVGRWSLDALGPEVSLAKSRNATIGSFTIVADNDVLGSVIFYGDDGTDYATPGASIFARVNGTPGANDLPTELVFAITKDAGSAVTEALQITISGFIFNEGGEDWDLRIESDTNANALTLDAGLFTGVGAIGLGAAALNTACVLVDPPALTAGAATNIARLRIGNTAAVTVPAGTTSIAAAVSIEEPNLTATGTITSAVTLYVAAAPTEGGTNNYALWVDAGVSAFGGNLVPDANDAAALGTTSLGFADLFLATGGVINFNNGDVTATHAANTLAFAGASSGYQFDAITFINDTANANMTRGLTINQGTANNEILTLKHTDVAHGMTSRTETDSYAIFYKNNTVGGLRLESLDGTNIESMWLTSLAGIASTTKTIAGKGPLSLNVGIKSGTTYAAVGPDGNLVTVQNDGTTRFIFDAEGSGHADVEWVAFDAEDDLQLVADIESLMVPEIFGEAVRYKENDLVGMKLFGAGSIRMEPNGKMRGMMNQTRMVMLHHGTLHQVFKELTDLKAHVKRTESQLKILSEKTNGTTM